MSLFILIGVKSRVLIIIGSVFPFFLGVILLLIVGLEINLGPEINITVLEFVYEALVDGIIPFDFSIGLIILLVFPNLCNIVL